MRPEGPWQRQTIFPPLGAKYRPQLHASHTGAPESPSPHTVRQKKRKNHPCPTRSPLLHLPPWAPAPGCISTSISPSPPVTGLSGVSSSGGAGPLRSLRGGEGDLHPLATRRTSRFAGHTLAWERRITAWCAYSYISNPLHAA